MADSNIAHDTTLAAKPMGSPKMSQRVPFAMSLLRECGVARVFARYERGITFSFTDARHKPVSNLVCTSLMEPIAFALQDILRERCPEYFDGDESQGYFEWDLRTDILSHQHMKTFPPL